MPPGSLAPNIVRTSPLLQPGVLGRYVGMHCDRHLRVRRKIDQHVRPLVRSRFTDRGKWMGLGEVLHQFSGLRVDPRRRFAD
jgi:hypothetical protein